MIYRANPVTVYAHQIVDVGDLMPDGSRHCALLDGRNVVATKEMLARMTPAPGDYWVIQMDGYVYLNPKEVFERKYALQAETPPPLAHTKKQIDFTRATELTPEVCDAIEDAFEYHKWTGAQIEAGMRIRQALAAAVKIIVQDVPPCPDRTVAIRKVREARMDANSAITHGGKY